MPDEPDHIAESVRTCEACAEETTDWLLHAVQQVYLCRECVEALNWSDRSTLIDGSS